MTRLLPTTFAFLLVSACGSSATPTLQQTTPPTERLVLSPAEVTVVTRRASTDPEMRFPFQARVFGSDNSEVTWAVRSPAGQAKSGKVDQTGVYMPPAATEGTETVVATWAGNEELTATAKVNLLLPEAALDIKLRCVGFYFVADTDNAADDALNGARDDCHSRGEPDDSRVIEVPAGEHPSASGVAVWVELEHPAQASVNVYRTYEILECTGCERVYQDFGLIDESETLLEPGANDLARYYSSVEINSGSSATTRAIQMTFSTDWTGKTIIRRVVVPFTLIP